ncbi:ATPase [Brochothrix thermosphacta]|uniref:heavy metal translocating P-type ATPase n=1 Tax=Brochothrix thermosphacta TaxID=2756 RepID=UPI000E713F6A|nr:heavy metal translocating P-type ATPase [Brochothrix thermosphacta]ANZ96101.1 ATPase [Brochothrix thermosphacta]
MDLIEKMTEYKELIAVGIAGVLIAIALILSAFNDVKVATACYLLAYIIGGYAKAKEGLLETFEKKALNVELLMIMAAIGSALIGYWMEGAILIFIFGISGALETYAMNKSKKEITALMGMQPQEAWRIEEDGATVLVPVTELKINDRVLIKPGEQVPTDGVVSEGETTINEAAITGESLPVLKTPGKEVFAGTLNGSGAIEIRMTKLTSETVFQKIIDLVATAQAEKSPAEQFIERFEGRYVKVILGIVGLMLFVPHYLVGWDWTTTFYRAMILLVVASPCALVASITPASLAAISNGAKRGILVKGGSYIEALSEVKTIVFDKTGTLTQGRPTDVSIYSLPLLEEAEILAILSGIERQSNHPIAQSICRQLEKQGVVSQQEFLVEEFPGWGIKGTVAGITYKVGKESWMNQVSVKQFLKASGFNAPIVGKTVVFMERDDEVVLMATLEDEVRPEAQAAIAEIQALGIQTIMLTGDNETTAKKISTTAGVPVYIANCLPADKVTEIKKLKGNNDLIAMVGDGINDAPALAIADVGIAMGKGTDVALETADVVLMKDDLTQIASTIKLSRKMKRIVKQNISFSIGVMLILIVSNFFQMMNLPFGVIGHEGSTILVILNSLRLLRSSH